MTSSTNCHNLAHIYYNKLDQMLMDMGRSQELSSWRKDFKRAWHKCEQASINLPLNDKYRPDAHCWVCTCPWFTISCCLICKHLCASSSSCPPIFFIELKHNHTTPFWSLHSLMPLVSDMNSLLMAVAALTLEDQVDSEQEDEQDYEDNFVNTNMNVNMGATI
jgi:hypothetical protein